MILNSIEALLWRVEVVVDAMMAPFEDPAAPLTKVFWLGMAGLASFMVSVGMTAAVAVSLWMGVFDPPARSPVAHSVRAPLPRAATPALPEIATSPAPGLVGECQLNLEVGSNVQAAVAQLSVCLSALR